MSPMKRWGILLALLAVLAGCSDSAESTSAGTTTSTAAKSVVVVESPGATTPAGSRCQPVVFPPTADDVAKDIVAYGLPCAEAESVVADAGGPLGPDRADRAEADGFTCVQTSSQVGHGYPWATYDCTRGGQRITFARYSTV